MHIVKTIAAVLAAVLALLASAAWYLAAQAPVIPVGSFWDVGSRPEDIALNNRLVRASVWNRRAALLSSLAAFCGAALTVADMIPS